MTLTNPNRFSTAGTSGTLGHITDAVDFPHTGLIKSLSLGMRGNYAVKTTNGFNITQAGSGNVIQVTSGFVFANGNLVPCDAKNFDSSLFTTSPANVSHLLVADVGEAQADRLKIIPHGANTANRIPDYADGNDVIIAVITYTSGFGNMTVQYLTTDKTSNALSIGYDSSGYTEMCKITAASGGTTVEVPTAGGDFIIDNTDADKKIVARLGTDTSATAFEVRNNSDAAKLTVLGTGATTIAGATTLSSIAACGSDTDKFLVSDSGVIKFRTGTEVASDIGALTGTLGIANNNILQANGNLADDDFLRVDGTQIEGRTAAQTLTDIAAMPLAGGTFTGSVIVDSGHSLGCETFASRRLATVSVSASTTLTEATHAGKYLICNGNVTLPTTSAIGVHFTILNTTGGNITVGRNGNNINNAASDATVATFNGVTCIAIGNNDWIALGV
tara:strand:- start:4925 stop:6262 length:1338 start_codon:yes stop_codon:yes gene_type:complete